VIEAEIDLTHEKCIAALDQEALEQRQELESRRRELEQQEERINL